MVGEVKKTSAQKCPLDIRHVSSTGGEVKKTSAQTLKKDLLVISVRLIFVMCQVLVVKLRRLQRKHSRRTFWS